jgi:hypothetical protein
MAFKALAGRLRRSVNQDLKVRSATMKKTGLSPRSNYT